MTVRAKTKKRLMVLVVGALVVGVGGGATWMVRKAQRRKGFEHDREVGLAAYQRGDYSLALDKLGACIAQFQRDPEVIRAMAESARNMPDLDGHFLRPSIQWYQSLLSLQPDDDQARHHLLDLYERGRLYTEMLGTAEKISAQNPKDASALRARTLALIALRRFDEAAKASQQWNDAAPDDLDGQARTLELMYVKTKSPEEIIKRVDALRAAHPNDPRFELVTSLGYVLIGDAKTAAQWAQKAATRTPPDNAFVKMLANDLDRLGLFTDATALLEHAIDQTDPELQRMLMMRWWNQGRYADIEAQLSKQHAETADPELLAIRAMALLQAGNKADAVKVADLLHDRAARNDVAAAWDPALRSLVDEKSDAHTRLKAVQTAQRMLPAEPLLDDLAGRLYAESGDEFTALRYWQLTAQVAPAWAEPFIQQSGLALGAGEVKAAYDLAVAAQQRAPKSRQVREGLAAAWASAVDAGLLQNGDQLLAFLKDLEQSFPDEEQTLPLYVRLLTKMGQNDAAKARLQAVAVSKTPPSEAALLSLAMLSNDLKLGQEDALLKRSEDAYGVTSKLAMARFSLMWVAKRSADGVKMMDELRAKHPADLSWEAAWAQCLEMAADPRAKDEWISLADKNQDDSRLQWAAVNARSVQGEHAFIGRALDRLQTQLGDQNTRLRFLRAQWLMAGNPGDKELSEAKSLMTDVIRVAPEYYEARTLQAMVLEHLNDAPGAVTQLVAASDLRPDNTAVAVEAARLLQIQGDFARSRDFINRAIRSKDLTSTDRNAAASILVELGAYDEALQLLRDAPKEKDAGPTLVLAALYRQQNDLDKAEDVCRELMKKPDASVIGFLADLQAFRGRMADAEKTLAQLDTLTVPPGLRELLRAKFYQRYAKPEQARDQYIAATKAAPKNVVVWRELTAWYLAQGNVDEAQKAVADASAALGDNELFDSLKQNTEIIRTLGPESAARALMVAWVEVPADQRAAILDGLQVLLKAKNEKLDGAKIVEQFRPVASRNPRVYELQIAMARFDLSQEQAVDAAAVASRAMEDFPGSADAAALASSAYASMGRWDDVIRTSREWRRRAQDSPQSADLAIGSAFLQQGHVPEAMQTVQPYVSRALADPDKNAPTVLLYLDILLKQGQMDQARQTLEPWLAKSANWRHIWITLAVDYAARDAALSADWLKHAKEVIPKDAVAELLSLANAWNDVALRSRQKSYQDTGRAILEELAAHPDAPAQVFVSLGVMRDTNSDVTGAEQAYRKALQLDANSAVAANNLAELILRRNGDLKEALELSSRAVKLVPDSVSFLDTRASVQAGLKKYDDALASIATAVQLAPSSLDLHLSQVSILADAGQMDQARRAFDEAVAVAPPAERIPDAQKARLSTLRTRLGK